MLVLLPNFCGVVYLKFYAPWFSNMHSELRMKYLFSFFFCGFQTCCGLVPLGCICSLFGLSLSERTGSDEPLRCPKSSFRADRHLDLLPQTPGSGEENKLKYKKA